MCPHHTAAGFICKEQLHMFCRYAFCIALPRCGSMTRYLPQISVAETAHIPDTARGAEYIAGNDGKLTMQELLEGNASKQLAVTMPDVLKAAQRLTGHAGGVETAYDATRERVGLPLDHLTSLLKAMEKHGYQLAVRGTNEVELMHNNTPMDGAGRESPEQAAMRALIHLLLQPDKPELELARATGRLPYTPEVRAYHLQQMKLLGELHHDTPLSLDRPIDIAEIDRPMLDAARREWSKQPVDKMLNAIRGTAEGRAALRQLAGQRLGDSYMQAPQLPDNMGNLPAAEQDAARARHDGYLQATRDQWAEDASLDAKVTTEDVAKLLNNDAELAKLLHADVKNLERQRQLELPDGTLTNAEMVWLMGQNPALPATMTEADLTLAEKQAINKQRFEASPRQRPYTADGVGAAAPGTMEEIVVTGNSSLLELLPQTPAGNALRGHLEVRYGLDDHAPELAELQRDTADALARAQTDLVALRGAGNLATLRGDRQSMADRILSTAPGRAAADVGTIGAIIGEDAMRGFNEKLTPKERGAVMLLGGLGGLAAFRELLGTKPFKFLGMGPDKKPGWIKTVLLALPTLFAVNAGIKVFRDTPEKVKNGVVEHFQREWADKGRQLYPAASRGNYLNEIMPGYLSLENMRLDKLRKPRYSDTAELAQPLTPETAMAVLQQPGNEAALRVYNEKLAQLRANEPADNAAEIQELNRQREAGRLSPEQYAQEMAQLTANTPGVPTARQRALAARERELLLDSAKALTGNGSAARIEGNSELYSPFTMDAEARAEADKLADVYGMTSEQYRHSQQRAYIELMEEYGRRIAAAGVAGDALAAVAADRAPNAVGKQQLADLGWKRMQKMLEDNPNATMTHLELDMLLLAPADEADDTPERRLRATLLAAEGDDAANSTLARLSLENVQQNGDTVTAMLAGMPVKQIAGGDLMLLTPSGAAYKLIDAQQLPASRVCRAARPGSNEMNGNTAGAIQVERLGELGASPEAARQSAERQLQLGAEAWARDLLKQQLPDAVAARVSLHTSMSEDGRMYVGLADKTDSSNMLLRGVIHANGDGKPELTLNAVADGDDFVAMYPVTPKALLGAYNELKRISPDVFTAEPSPSALAAVAAQAIRLDRLRSTQANAAPANNPETRLRERRAILEQAIVGSDLYRTTPGVKLESALATVSNWFGSPMARPGAATDMNPLQNRRSVGALNNLLHGSMVPGVAANSIATRLADKMGYTLPFTSIEMSAMPVYELTAEKNGVKNTMTLTLDERNQPLIVHVSTTDSTGTRESTGAILLSDAMTTGGSELAIMAHYLLLTPSRFSSAPAVPPSLDYMRSEHLRTQDYLVATTLRSHLGIQEIQ